MRRVLNPNYESTTAVERSRSKHNAYGEPLLELDVDCVIASYNSKALTKVKCEVCGVV